MKSITVNHFTGIRNVVSIRHLAPENLAAALDCDLTDTGALPKCRGYQLALSAPISAAYSSQEQAGYVVSNGKLCRFADNRLVELADSTATEFCDFGQEVFSNDGLRIKGDSVTDIKLDPPIIAPVLSPTSGDLPPGRYIVAYTFINQDGLESGSSPVSVIELQSTSGISVAPIQSGYRVNLYISDAGGTVLYDSENVQMAQENVLANGFPENAEKIAFYDTKLFVSKPLDNGDTIIYFSQPYYFHLWKHLQDYLIIPGRVNAMMSARDGLVIGTDSDIWVYNGAGVGLLADYGVPKGKSMAQTPDKNVLIHTKRGQCVALPFQNLTETKCSLKPGEHCSTAYVEHGGISQFLVLTDGKGKAYNPNFLTEDYD